MNEFTKEYDINVKDLRPPDVQPRTDATLLQAFLDERAHFSYPKLAPIKPRSAMDDLLDASLIDLRLV